MLLLPAINAVREMGRRTQCINNQRNLVVALIHYESAQGAFPCAVPLCDSRVFNSLGRETGIACMGPNWASQMLGFVEEQKQYEQLFECLQSQWHASDDCGDQPGHVGRTTPAYMLCPSGPAAPKSHQSVRSQLSRLAKGNYAACLGSEHYRTGIEDDRWITHEEDDHFQVGVMSVIVIDDFARLIELTRKGTIQGEWKWAHGQGTPTQKIKDGTSKTIVLSEVMPWDGVDNASAYSLDIRGVWTSPSMGASTYTHKYGPNSPMPDRLNVCDRRIPRDHRLHCDQMPAHGPDAAETWASARSAHRSGVVAGLADGSVKFFADDIHLPIWQALATRAGGER